MTQHLVTEIEPISITILEFCKLATFAQFSLL